MTQLSMRTHRKLTPRQRHVMFVLAEGPHSRNDWAAWYPLRTEQVYPIIASLSRRGLVDVAGFADDGTRTFRLTDAGHEAVAREVAAADLAAEETE